MSCRSSFERYDQDLFRYFDADFHPRVRAWFRVVIIIA